MSILKKPNYRWLPLALVPLFSMSVLVGCGSDDDDGDALDVDPVLTDPVVVGDTDNTGIPDAFETIVAADDLNDNGIADVYEDLAPGAPTEAADANDNNVDDSYEVALTGGLDADADGVDDAAATALASGGAPGGETPDGGGAPGGETPDGGGAPGGETPDGGEETPDGGEETPDGGEETPTVPQTGNLNLVNIGQDGSAGIGDLDWDGTTLTGQVNIPDGVTADSAAIYTGISAAGTGQQAVQLNGENPTFFVPNGMAADQAALIADNIVSGNLFVQVELSDGTSVPGIILLDTVQPKFTTLSAANAVPPGDEFSNGAAFINLNTETGDFSAALTVNLNATDGETVTAAHIHVGAPGEDGPVIQPLTNPSGDTVTWTATGVLSTADLASLLDGNTYFNVHRTDESNFIRGQITGN